MKYMIEPDWLREHLNDPNLIVLDASYPQVGGEKSSFEDHQILGARIFEIDYFSDQSNPLPHMLAPSDEFQEKARNLGVYKNSHLIIYDNLGIYSSPRAWWMFKAMGHDNVSVLNGGLPEWIEKRYPVEKKMEREIFSGDFVANLQSQLVKSITEVKRNLETKTFQVIDARSKGRFDGSLPEPRPRLSSGHMPHSVNVPFEEVLEKGRLKSEEELKKMFSHVDTSMPLTFSCGSGLTACITLMAADQVLDNEKSVYDGSWVEWASKGEVIIK
ncbi:MAG: rhodanese-like domain-containing protein [Bacteroidota bacterium]